jgi:SAM-dependent methyltransferase
MSRNHNPQAEQMGDESMARNLAHQAEAIWPQEQRLFNRYGLSGSLRILDLGCGTGEITRRLAERYPQAMLLGIDILEGNLALARRDSAALGQRIRYAQGDAFALDLADGGLDLVVCRHMSQAVPDFPLVLAEITRVLRPGGWLHVLSEDYGMLHFPAPLGVNGHEPDGFDPDRFWNANAIAFLRSIGCDGRIGRHSPTLLQMAGYLDVAMDYVSVSRVTRSPTSSAHGATAMRNRWQAPQVARSQRSRRISTP